MGIPVQHERQVEPVRAELACGWPDVITMILAVLLQGRRRFWQVLSGVDDVGSH